MQAKKKRDDSRRKRYTTPRLRVHGTVEMLTQGIGAGSPDSPTGGPPGSLGPF